MGQDIEILDFYPPFLSLLLKSYPSLTREKSSKIKIQILPSHTNVNDRQVEIERLGVTFIEKSSQNHRQNSQGKLDLGVLY
mgnify:FL=1